jgi:hypothetical protein
MNTCTPSKDFKKHGHKNAIKVIKHKNTTPPPGFSHNPMYCLKRIIK